jgi:hypothetical protein
LSDFFGDTGWDGSLDEPETTAEAVAVEEAPAVEVPVEEAPEETPEAVAPEPRERDEAGRFVPKKLEVDDPDVLAFLDKYQGDPVKALKAATEAQRTIGGMANELGELRALREQMAQVQERLDTPVAPQQPITQELIYENPAIATRLAYEQGNTTALTLAFEQWKEDAPADAVSWAMTQQMEARDREWAAKLEQIEQRVAPMSQAQEDQAYARVVREIAAADPGVIERIQAGASDLAPEISTTLYAALEHGTPTQKIGAFKALAELTRGRDVPATLDVRALAREQALAADEAIAEAAVVTTNTAKAETAGKTMADQIGEEWDQIERPLADGWNLSR